MSTSLIRSVLRWSTVLAMSAWLAGCAAPQKKDYSALRAAKPASILVLPPVNDAPEVQASASVLSYATRPLAEAGYYVMPVTLVSETFRQNGLEISGDIHEVSPTKLKEIFGADSALYIKITKYGSSYQVINSVAIVSAEARLVDLRTGTTLWNGRASASSDEGGNNSGGGLAGMLITALVKQIINTATDASHTVAGVATNRLLAAGHPGGLLYGPRSPMYGKD
ncbi:lipoprotein [Comamonas phosphati]|nr:lipoprotein [Comamonas phosphati]